MDIDHIQRIAEIVKENGLTELELESKDWKLHIRKEFPPQQVVQFAAPQLSGPAMPPALSAPAASVPAEDTSLLTVKSPMVGTFYRAASPETPPFVDMGSKVDTDSVVCILEAMKVMNEIHAEVKGTIVEILVENGQPVEFGQALFKVKP